MGGTPDDHASGDLPRGRHSYRRDLDPIVNRPGDLPPARPAACSACRHQGVQSQAIAAVQLDEWAPEVLRLYCIVHVQQLLHRRPEARIYYLCPEPEAHAVRANRVRTDHGTDAHDPATHQYPADHGGPAGW